MNEENKKHLIENCVGSNIFSNLNDLDIFLLAEKNLYDLYEFRFNLKYKKPTYFENIFNDAIKINNFLVFLILTPQKLCICARYRLFFRRSRGLLAS